MGPSDIFSLVASLLAVGITAAVGWATHKSAQKAAERNVNTQSRTDIEKEAFERAKEFYTDTIDRQTVIINDLETDVAELKKDAIARDKSHAREVDALRKDLEKQKLVHLASVREMHHDHDVVKTELRRCQALIRAKFPDDDPELYKPQT